MAQAVQVKAPCAKQWRSIAMAFVDSRARYTAYWRWRYCTTHVDLALKTRWCAAGPIWTCVFVSTDGNRRKLVLEGEDVGGEIRTQEAATLKTRGGIPTRA